MVKPPPYISKSFRSILARSLGDAVRHSPKGVHNNISTGSSRNAFAECVSGSTDKERTNAKRIPFIEFSFGRLRTALVCMNAEVCGDRELRPRTSALICRYHTALLLQKETGNRTNRFPVTVLICSPSHLFGGHKNWPNRLFRLNSLLIKRHWYTVRSFEEHHVVNRTSIRTCMTSEPQKLIFIGHHEFESKVTFLNPLLVIRPNSLQIKNLFTFTGHCALSLDRKSCKQYNEKQFHSKSLFGFSPPLRTTTVLRCGDLCAQYIVRRGLRTDIDKFVFYGLVVLEQQLH